MGRFEHGDFLCLCWRVCCALCTAYPSLYGNRLFVWAVLLTPWKGLTMSAFWYDCINWFMLVLTTIFIGIPMFVYGGTIVLGTLVWAYDALTNLIYKENINANL